MMISAFFHHAARHGRAGRTGAGGLVKVRVGLGLLLMVLAACRAAPPAAPAPGGTTTTTPPPPGAQPSPSAPAPAVSPTLAAGIATPTLAPGSAAPAPGTWAHYPGLNEVSSLVFDPQGFLWAGTRAGVVRWDLTRAAPRHYPFADCTGDLGACGPETHWVHDLALAPSGNGGATLWAATTGGVRRLDPGGGADGTWTTFTQSHGLPDRGAASVAVGPDGTVWAGTTQGLARFDAAAGSWTAITDPGLGAGATIWAVEVAADGSPSGAVWFSTHGLGVVRLDPDGETWETFGTGAGFAYPNARALELDSAGRPWVHIGYDHVYRFDGSSWVQAYTAGGGQWVCDFAFGAALAAPAAPLIATCDGYRAYGDGIAYPEGEAWSYLDVSDGLPANDVQALAVGPSGELAAGTLRGVAVYRDGTWRTLRHGPTLNDVTAVAATEDAAWFAFGDDAFRSAGGGLARFDGVTWHYRDGVGDAGLGANLRTLAVAPDGALWAGAGCLLARREGDGWVTVVDCDDLSGNVRALAFGPDGAPWFTTDFHAYHREPGGDLAVHESLVPIALAVDAAGGVWISKGALAGGGLVRFDGAVWVTSTVPLSVLTSLAALPNGTLWALGDRGLAQREAGGWSATVPLPGALTHLVAGPAGALWGYGPSGVWRRTGEGWDHVADPGAPVQAMAFAPGAAGMGLWLGTPRGGVYVGVKP